MGRVGYWVVPILFIILFSIGSGVGVYVSGDNYVSQLSSEGVVVVRVSPETVYSMQPSYIVFNCSGDPTVKVVLTIEVSGVGSRSFEYYMEPVPLPWRSGWYIVPVPGLPSIVTSRVSVSSSVSYEIYVGGSLVKKGSYDVEPISSGYKHVNKPPLVYAFVSDIFSDPSTIEETLGLSPKGWSLAPDATEDVYVLVLDDNGLSNVTLSYRVNEGSWNNLSLESTGVLQNITSIVGDINDWLKGLGLNIPQVVAPPFELYKATIPSQSSGSIVEFRASAIDTNGTVSYSPHGLFFVDNPRGKQVLVIDPSLLLWSMSSIVNDYKPVVAVDLGHGERNNYLDQMMKDIPFVKWKVINTTFTSENLRDVDILILGQPQVDLLADEVNAIVEWFSKGNKVIWIAGDGDWKSRSFDGPRTEQICNNLLSRLGSRLRIEYGEILDDVHNLGRSYRLLGTVKPDKNPDLITSIISDLVRKPVLFHGTSAVIWVDENGKYHDPVNETFPGLLRIAWSSNTSYIVDYNPPQPMLYDPAKDKNRSFVLMAVEIMNDTGNIVVASGETPYGGFEPMYSPEYIDHKLGGPVFIKNFMAWLRAYLFRLKYRVFQEYSSPAENIYELRNIVYPLSFTGDNIVNLHHWELISKDYDIYIVKPGRLAAEILEEKDQSFKPRAIILSNLFLGINITPDSPLNWDLRDIIINKQSLLSILREYVEKEHAGLIVTHGTLFDQVIWTSCREKVKLGARGHTGYGLPDIYEENSLASLIGLPQLTLWEILRDEIADKLCLLSKELPAPANLEAEKDALIIGSTPLQVPYIPWNGILKPTSQAEELGWSLPDEIKVSIPSPYNSRGYEAYTEIGWQLAFPYDLFIKGSMETNKTTPTMVYLYRLFDAYMYELMNNINKEPVTNMSQNINMSIQRVGPTIYDYLVKSVIKANNKLRITIDPEKLFGKTNLSKDIVIEIDLSKTMKELVSSGKPVIIAVSPDYKASIIGYDKSWSDQGYRSVYFSFEVEASNTDTAKKLLLQALEWSMSWRKDPDMELLGGVLPLYKDLVKEFNETLSSINGSTVFSEPLIMPEKGGKTICFPAARNKRYHIVIAHPTTQNIYVDVYGGDILTKETKDMITHIVVLSKDNNLTITLRPSSDLSLNPAYIEIVEEEQPPTTTTVTVTTTVTSTITSTMTETTTVMETTTITHSTIMTQTTTYTTTIEHTKTETKTITNTMTKTETTTQTIEKTTTKTQRETTTHTTTYTTTITQIQYEYSPTYIALGLIIALALIISTLILKKR